MNYAPPAEAGVMPCLSVRPGCISFGLPLGGRQEFFQGTGLRTISKRIRSFTLTNLIKDLRLIV